MKDDILELRKCDSDVRCAVARNLNTPSDVLIELAKDANNDVRCSSPEIKFYKQNNFVSIQGTTHLWTKIKSKNNIYICGCFIGTHEQLLSRIRQNSSGYMLHKRLQLLNILDSKFEEIFG